MLIKVFPHGTGEGDKPTRYLVRPDYPGRDTAPPLVLRGDPAMTRELINSIDRRWKFTSGVLSWHPDENISEAEEDEVMDAFEQVAFAGLESDQSNILWVRHSHAGHHELHFVIPRMELSSGKDLNAFPPGWQKDFAVFRDLLNWRNGWARPDDPARAREELPKKADLFKARMARWGKEVRESDRDRAKETIHAMLKAKIEQGLVRNREDILNALRESGMEISRAGKDYISVKMPDNGLKLRFKGGIYTQGWTPKLPQPEESEEEKARKRKNMLIRLEAEFQQVVQKRVRINTKRYPVRWAPIEAKDMLVLPEPEEVDHDRNRTDAVAVSEADGRKQQRQTDRVQHSPEHAGGKNHAAPDGSAHFEEIVRRCQRSVQQLADLVAELEKERIEREQSYQAPRMRMR